MRETLGVPIESRQLSEAFTVANAERLEVDELLKRVSNPVTKTRYERHAEEYVEVVRRGGRGCDDWNWWRMQEQLWGKGVQT